MGRRRRKEKKGGWQRKGGNGGGAVGKGGEGGSGAQSESDPRLCVCGCRPVQVHVAAATAGPATGSRLEIELWVGWHCAVPTDPQSIAISSLSLSWE